MSSYEYSDPEILSPDHPCAMDLVFFILENPELDGNVTTVKPEDAENETLAKVEADRFMGSPLSRCHLQNCYRSPRKIRPVQFP